MRSWDYNLIETSSGFELIGLTDHHITGRDPDLGGLSAKRGEKTATHALQSGSPAIDAGSCTDLADATITTDQRAVKRPQGSHCDIGAYEFAQPNLSLDKSVDDAMPQPGQRIAYTIVVENSGAAAATAGRISDTLPLGLSLAGPITLQPPTAGKTDTLPTLAVSLTIPAGESVAVTLPVTVSASLSTPMTIVNVAAVTAEQITEARVGSRSILVTRGLHPRVYLPILIRLFQ